MADSWDVIETEKQKTNYKQSKDEQQNNAKTSRQLEQLKLSVPQFSSKSI